MGIIRLAVDAMGGDFAPHEIVIGAARGARRLGISLLLVGDPALIQAELDEVDCAGLSIEIAPAGSVIGMHENPAQAVRSQPEASINIACQLVLAGRADGVVTMGHTGAGMIAALFKFGRIPGVERPAVIVPLLGLRENLYLIDAGANTEVKPKHLLQFAQMGSIYLEQAIGITHPRIGLLSNGAEANKGNTVGREAYVLLEQADGVNFCGNIEGNSIWANDLNLIVTDGFTGNVLLKSTEGALAQLLTQVEEILPRLTGEPADLLQTHLQELRLRNHYARHGVSTLLGVRHPMFIGHGRSKAEAVINGMATAQRVIASGVMVGMQRAFFTQASSSS
jgi:glycerol-3-phosphate acyltransferase PlsX